MRTQKLNQARALAKEALGPQEDFEEVFSVTGFQLMWVERRVCAQKALFSAAAHQLNQPQSSLPGRFRSLCGLAVLGHDARLMPAPDRLYPIAE
jgi:hypothetical protein